MKKQRATGDILLSMIRWLMLVMFAASLLIYGGTAPHSLIWLEAFSVLVPASYVIIKWCNRENWSLDKPILCGAGWMLLIGWIAAVFPASVYDRELRAFLPVSDGFRIPWGSVDGAISTRAMFRILGIFGCFFVFADMATRVKWRRRFVRVILVLCGMLAIFGLCQRVWGNLFEYWQVTVLPPNVFGFFWYHGNAGAYLNLCWPLLAVWVLKGGVELNGANYYKQIKYAIQVMVFIACTTSIVVNIARAAHVVFFLQVVALGCSVLWAVKIRGNAYGVTMKVVVWLALVGIVFAATIVMGVLPGRDRWMDFLVADGFVNNPRWGALFTMLKWIPEVIVVGYGPGTFGALFVVKASGSGDAPSGYWEYAHNDHIQTILEWGFLGYLVWVAIALRVLFLTFRYSQESQRSGMWFNHYQRFSIGIALIGVATHAAVDFPLQIFGIQMLIAVLGALGSTKVLD